AIDQRLAEILQGLTALIVGVVVAFSFGWNMAPFCIALAVLLVLIQTGISSYLKKRGAQDAKIAEEASRIVTESIENVRTVQALTRQEKLYNDFCRASEIPHKRAIVRGFFQSASYSVSGSYVSFNFWASYLFGMWLVNSDFSEPFIVFQVIEALNMAAMLISSSASYFPEYIKARIAAGLMFGMIRKEPAIDNLSDSGIVTPIRGNVVVSKVRFAYPNGRRYLTCNDLNVTANFGNTVALVGPSGCGKSTVISLIERFYDTLGGIITIDGKDIRTLNIRHMRNAIALVGQEPTLFNISIRDNITYGLENVKDEEVIKAAQLANIHSFIESLPNGYDTSVGGRGTQLSGGQRQRIAIARAVIRNPRILLLDEATAALDGESEKIVQEALDRAKYGRTCLVVAHRLSTIQNADIICVIENGKCVEFGNHQTLLERRGLYYRLVKSQSMD
uniref:p-glycoprotein n=1 Tax=Panagrolaimus sp. PS1159 TaxID=55785 RepID=A0AC35GE69_9BILA